MNRFDYRWPLVRFSRGFQGNKEPRANLEGLSLVGIVRLIACGGLSAEGASRYGFTGCGWGASGGC